MQMYSLSYYQIPVFIGDTKVYWLITYENDIGLID